ncbi:MAG TPA: hypothetical protein VMI75_19995 [Polyangiaceae bacterium]|nr:hypothetical protein [Polyangiaceae bacterium]
MSNVRRGWVLGASVVILAAGVAAAASPRRAPDLAAARDARHAVASSRPAAKMPVIVPVAETPRPAPPPLPVVRRPARPAPSSTVTAVLEDPPAPEPLPMPMTWEDLFPAQPASSRSGSSSMPCFDQLQGVGGVSPCSETTTRALR